MAVRTGRTAIADKEEKDDELRLIGGHERNEGQRSRREKKKVESGGQMSYIKIRAGDNGNLMREK